MDLAILYWITAQRKNVNVLKMIFSKMRSTPWDLAHSVRTLQCYPQ